MEKIGTILKKYMDPEVPQARYSKQLDVTPQYMNNILNDKKIPSQNFLSKFYNFFKVSLQDREKIRDLLVSNKLPKGYTSIVSEYREIKSQFEDVVSIPVLGEVDGDILKGEVTFFNKGFKQKNLFSENDIESIYIQKLNEGISDSFVIKNENEIYIFQKACVNNLDLFFKKRNKNIIIFSIGNFIKVTNVEYIKENQIYLFFDFNKNNEKNRTTIFFKEDFISDDSLNMYDTDKIKILGVLIGNIII